MKSVIAVLGAVLVSGCQTYDFEQVTPMALSQERHYESIKAKTLKPNVMLLVDTSGSMGELTDPNSRISQLKLAMNTFFSGDSATLARYGLAVFPEAAGPTRTIKVAIPPATSTDVGTDGALQANADAVNAAIQALPQPQDGTPTSASLAFLGEDPVLNAADDRSDFILLLTDGLPNGNDANPVNLCDCYATNSCAQARIDACMCAAGNCANSSYCAAGCLDADGTVATISGLHAQKQIDTIVVGFGDDLTTGVAPQVLDRMARAGDQPRSCKNDPTACGAEACGADGVCATSFYKASDSAGLAAALEAIIDNIKGDVCVWTLATPPSDPGYLSVIVDGETLAEGPETYTYDGNLTITLKGSTCLKAQNSTPQNPLDLDIRAVSKL